VVFASFLGGGRAGALLLAFSFVGGWGPNKVVVPPFMDCPPEATSATQLRVGDAVRFGDLGAPSLRRAVGLREFQHPPSHHVGYRFPSARGSAGSFLVSHRCFGLEVAGVRARSVSCLTVNGPGTEVHWASKGVFGERIWTEGDRSSFPPEFLSKVPPSPGLPSCWPDRPCLRTPGAQRGRRRHRVLICQVAKLWSTVSPARPWRLGPAAPLVDLVAISAL
jgi:hypothetical protein